MDTTTTTTNATTALASSGTTGVPHADPSWPEDQKRVWEDFQKESKGDPNRMFNSVFEVMKKINDKNKTLEQENTSQAGKLKEFESRQKDELNRLVALWKDYDENSTEEGEDTTNAQFWDNLKNPENKEGDMSNLIQVLANCERVAAQRTKDLDQQMDEAVPSSSKKRKLSSSSSSSPASTLKQNNPEEGGQNFMHGYFGIN